MGGHESTKCLGLKERGEQLQTDAKLECESVVNEMTRNICCCYGRIGGGCLIECIERDKGAIGATERSDAAAPRTVIGRLADDWRPDIAHY